MRKPKCFVSYCEKDASVEKVNAIVKRIKRLSEIHNSPIEFLFDKNLKTGEDLNQFMDSISFVDSVIMICTPEYKNFSLVSKSKKSPLNPSEINGLSGLLIAKTR